MTDTSDNIALVINELKNAKRKHRRFVHNLVPIAIPAVGLHPERAEWTRILNKQRAILRRLFRKKNLNLAAVMSCEYYEAMEAYSNGDLAHARQELAQCAAVCIRGMEYIQSELDNRKQENDK